MNAKIVMLVILIGFHFFYSNAQSSSRFQSRLKDERGYIREWCFDHLKDTEEGEWKYVDLKLGNEIFDSVTRLKVEGDLLHGTAVLDYGEANVSGHFSTSDSCQISLITLDSSNYLTWVMDIHLDELDIRIGLDIDSFFVFRNQKLVKKWNSTNDTAESSIKFGDGNHEIRLDYGSHARSEYIDTKKLLLYVNGIEVYNFSHELLKKKAYQDSLAIGSSWIVFMEEMNLENGLVKSLMMSFIKDQSLDVTNLVRFDYHDMNQVELVSNLLGWGEDNLSVFDMDGYSYSEIGYSVVYRSGRYYLHKRPNIDYIFN
ncbi:hypothetical protein [Croceimicrobium sp.]|uniref:hypothetical protein n=1 Tax=Croceimicrobium sp. TaxID=2828340 RepID=UPI003BAD642B